MATSPAISDPQTPSSARRWPAGTASALLLATLVVAVGLLSAGGCKRPPGIVTEDSKGSTEKTDPWVTAARKLAKDTDFSTCKTVLLSLNENLRNDESAQKPAAMSAEWEQSLEAVPLGREDKEEIHNWAYSSHDAAYLAECLYLRDVAQSLRLPNLTDEQLADLAFAWVCRTVSLSEAPFGTDIRTSFVLRAGDGARTHVYAAAVPPTYVLRRGSGTGLERMYVFLALLQQLELDGCLLGPQNAGPVAATDALAADGRPIPGGPPRPFWGAGVRIGADIRVYDPWRGEALPAPFKSLRSNPDLHAAWFYRPDSLTRLKASDVAEAVVYLAVPVNALSVRMELLNQKLKDLGVRLAYRPAALRGTFGEWKPVFWNPPNDRFAYGRVSRGFLPAKLGGNPPDGALYETYRQVQVPLSGVDLDLPEFRDKDMEGAAERLVSATFSLYVQAFIDPPNPRERIQRGQFQDAIRDLVEKQDRFSKGLELLHNTPDADERIRGWVRDARQLYANLGAPGAIADPDARQAAIAAAHARIESHWKERSFLMLITRYIVPVCQAETVFELCLCKHEMAERAQVRAAHATEEDAQKLKEQARDAWKEARLQWQTYEGYIDVQSRTPGRVEQARALKARADKYAAEAVK